MATLDSIIAKATGYVNDVVNLRVITAVGEFSATYNETTQKWDVTPGASANSAILTNIDLVQGDIVNLMPQAFSGDGGKAVRDFHSTQVEKAEGIVRANIAALKGMIEVLVSAEQAKTS
jgi:hypothetical protein